MFDCNNFKKQVKDWIKDNPVGSVPDLVDYCDELIPSQYYTTHSWLVDQTVGWYKHILMQREHGPICDD